MADFSLREQEHEVERSRTKLTQDLGVLCSSETFAAFTDDLKKEAFETRDAFWEKLKARAASNPAAVIAIGAGLAWRIIQHPPIASALIGVGLFSLWKTQPKTAYDAEGKRLDYAQQSKEVLREPRVRRSQRRQTLRKRFRTPRRPKARKSGTAPRKNCENGRKTWAARSLTQLQS